MSRRTLSMNGRVHAHGGTVRKLNIMSDKTVKELENIIKALKLKTDS
jgi:hypothetical protein